MKTRRILIGFLIIAAVVGVCSTAASLRRQGLRRVEMMQFSDLLLSHIATYSRLPEGLKPEIQMSGNRGACSWRLSVAALEYQRQSYRGSQEEWDAPDASTADNWPSYNLLLRSKTSKFARVMLVTGEDTAFDPAVRFTQGRWDTLPKDLIVAIETKHSDVDWKSPKDIAVGDLAGSLGILIGIGRPSTETFLIGFKDGSVWEMRGDVPLKQISTLCTVSGASASDREKVLSDTVVNRWPTKQAG